MKWVVVKKGEKYKRKLELDETEWLVLTMLVGIACIVVLSLIFEGV